jgi:hypothetical protein
MTIQNNRWLYEAIGKAKRDSALDTGMPEEGFLPASALGAKVKALIGLAVAITSSSEAFTIGHIDGARGGRRHAP